jgi:hypothetical protein
VLNERTRMTRENYIYKCDEDRRPDKSNEKGIAETSDLAPDYCTEATSRITMPWTTQIDGQTSPFGILAK